jgi:branched-chain amino acid transport system ATP-binding protein
MGAPLLELDGLVRRFGGFRAVDDVSLTVPEGARLGVIGPNGAGKSTLFRLISGTLKPTAGRVRFAGGDVTARSEDRRARLGVAQTFQHSSLFLSFTCREAVELVLQRLDGSGVRLRRRRAASAARADEVLERVGLGDRRAAVTASLSHGERRQLEIAVALAARPRLLLLDEPSAGMSAAETRRLAEVMATLPDELSVILVEHDLEFVFGVVRDVAVMHLGRLIAQGTAEEIRASDEVERVYLGAAAGDELFIDEPEVPA